MIYRQYLKRLIDIVVALGLIWLTLPLQVVIALVLAIMLGPRHILFFQTRIGRNDKAFRIIKFSSLRPAPLGQDLLTLDPRRAFGFGRLLRQTVLDELPQLYQILIGQMSLIGPRPLLPQYLPLYSAQQQKRHLVRPGITGLAQVRGGNTVSWEDRFALDVEYVETYGLRLDYQIIVESIQYLLKARRQQEPDMMEVWKG
jgi:lipopolysaccharide/colanic/teichoic acid biosynthesis glycosyltransferase